MYPNSSFRQGVLNYRATLTEPDCSDFEDRTIVFGMENSSVAASDFEAPIYIDATQEDSIEEYDSEMHMQSASNCDLSFPEGVDEEYLMKVQEEMRKAVTETIRQFMETMTNDFLNLKMQLCREFTKREIETKKKWDGFYETLNAIGDEEVKDVKCDGDKE